MPPAMTDFARHDSMPACICGHGQWMSCDRMPNVAYHLHRLLLVITQAGIDTTAAHAWHARERHAFEIVEGVVMRKDEETC